MEEKKNMEESQSFRDLGKAAEQWGPCKTPLDEELTHKMTLSINYILLMCLVALLSHSSSNIFL